MLVWHILKGAWKPLPVILLFSYQMNAPQLPKAGRWPALVHYTVGAVTGT